MTVKEIIKEYLIRNNFDGLYNSDECGCDLKDLMDCENDCSTCEPGYKMKCPEGCGEDHSYHIGQKKEIL